MSKQPETLFKERVQRDCDEIRRKGGELWEQKIQQRVIRGTPDMLFCARGAFIALELKKSAKEKPDPSQEHTLAQIAGAGGYAASTSPEIWPLHQEAIERLARGRAPHPNDEKLFLPRGLKEYRLNVRARARRKSRP